MTPDYHIIANDQDITERIRSRLLSLTVSDEAGVQADTVEFSLDDRDECIQWPEHGAELTVSMGYLGQGLVFMGRYIVDEVSYQDPPKTLTVRAKAADMQTDLKAPKTRSWSPQTISEVVSTIAREHDLIPRVSPALAKLELPHWDQTEESDLHFLTRLARPFDALAKPANGYCVFIPKGEANSVSGEPLPLTVITPSMVVDYRLTQAERGKYGSVMTFWHDVERGERVSIRTGEGDPVYTVRESFGRADHAADAGRATLQRLTRGTATLSLNLVGYPSLYAESDIEVDGLRDRANGRWRVHQVKHTLSAQGFKTHAEATIPNTQSA